MLRADTHLGWTVEALNRLIRSAFLAELKASKITTLDALNEAFRAWLDLQYHRTVHSETGQTPLDRWRAGLERVRYVDDEDLRLAFLWKERRTPDKAGVFSLLGIRYQVAAGLGRRHIEVRFDPEALHEVEVWRQGEFVQRARPLDVQAHRRPRDPSAAPAGAEADREPVVDWLGHLVRQQTKQGAGEIAPRDLTEQTRARRAEADAAILELLCDRLDPDIVEPETVQAWLDTYGPLEPERAASALDHLLAQGHPADQHVTVTLDAIRALMKGAKP